VYGFAAPSSLLQGFYGIDIGKILQEKIFLVTFRLITAHFLYLSANVEPFSYHTLSKRGLALALYNLPDFFFPTSLLHGLSTLSHRARLSRRHREGYLIALAPVHEFNFSIPLRNSQNLVLSFLDPFLLFWYLPESGRPGSFALVRQ